MMLGRLAVPRGRGAEKYALESRSYTYRVERDPMSEVWAS
jgi:hypothetical protein